MTAPDLFSSESEIQPHRHVTLGGQEYRAQVQTRHERIHVHVEFRHPIGGWVEVRFLLRRLDVIEATGLGKKKGDRVQLEDGRFEGDPMIGDTT